jgi:hypothetical protein
MHQEKTFKSVISMANAAYPSVSGYAKIGPTSLPQRNTKSKYGENTLAAIFYALVPAGNNPWAQLNQTHGRTTANMLIRNNQNRKLLSIMIISASTSGLSRHGTNVCFRPTRKERPIIKYGNASNPPAIK